MKLTTLLAQFLYKHKRLDLPEIGTFQLDASVVIDQENTRHNKASFIEGVSFENKKSVSESPELIQFISEHTGKIKALASADLASHLGLALQFINIGKPFLFEGIGSLSKAQTGELIYTPGYPLTEKLADQPLKDVNTNAIEEPASDYKSVFYSPKVKLKWAKPLAVFLVLAGLGLAIWGGYTVYKRTAAEDNNLVNINEPEKKVVLTEDTTTQLVLPVNILNEPVPGGMVKFIIETANRERAFPRYTQLKKFKWDVKMETKDSVSYKIYMLFPLVGADTTSIKDSLSRLTGRSVYISN